MQRIPVWREVLGRSIVKLDMEPLGDGPFRCEATVRMLPGLVIGSNVSSPNRVARTRELIAADGSDDIVLLTVRGRAFISQLGRDATIADGDAILLSKAEQASISFPATVRFRSLTVPAAALTPIIASVDAALVSVIPRNNEALQHLATYAEWLSHDRPLATAVLRRAVAAHVYDLMAMAVGATRDAAARAEHGGIRAARLRAVKAYVLESLGRDDLSIASVAARQRITPRYVQKLFESEGTTFSEFVLNQRLSRVHRMLTDPRMAAQHIGTIAFDAGFGDLSYFNQAFRRRFGAAPSDIRAAARRADKA